MKYYAVKNGRVPGIYTSWSECKQQVMGYSSAVYKSFTSKQDALAYLGAGTGAAADSSPDAEQGEISTRAWAYVDGSYLHKQKKYSYGMIIFDGKNEHRFAQAFEDAEMASMRNVAGEITGSMRAVEFCLENEIESVTIFYDYEGIQRWADGDWKTNKPQTKAYAEFIRAAREKMRVEFVKVRGHSGDKYNDIADALAKGALGI